VRSIFKIDQTPYKNQLIQSKGNLS